MGDKLSGKASFTVITCFLLTLATVVAAIAIFEMRAEKKEQRVHELRLRYVERCVEQRQTTPGNAEREFPIP